MIFFKAYKKEEKERKRRYRLRTKALPPNNKKSIFLLLTPEHNNLGDHAIAEAQKQFLRDFFPEYYVYEINYMHFQYERKKLNAIVKQEDIIVISGGGYLGDVWPHDDEMVRSIVREYRDNQVVIFPQTIYYKDDSLSIFEKTKSDYESHNNLLFCVRDTNSFELLQKLSLKGKSKVIFTPDMVLYFQIASLSCERKCVGVCFREDIEKRVNDELVQSIQSKLTNNNEIVVRFNTQLTYDVQVRERDNELKKMMQMYRTFKYIITDRLHAMLFAVITGTPCIALDNLTYKLSGVYPWIENLGYIWMAKSMKDVDYYIKHISGEEHQFDRYTFQNEFKTIFLEMKERIE